MIQPTSAYYPSHIGSRSLLSDAFSFLIICISHLILDYLVVHLLWNHCRSTSFYPNCMFITRHYSLASSLYPSIMHYYHFPCQSVPCAQSGMSVMLMIQVFLDLVVSRVNFHCRVVILGDVKPNAVSSLVRQPVLLSSNARQ